MKRIDLIRKLEEAGYVLIRHGGKHGTSGPVSRNLCLAIGKSKTSSQNIS